MTRTIHHRCNIYSDGSIIFFNRLLARVKTSFEQYGVSRPTFKDAADYKPLEPGQPWIKGLPDAWQIEGDEFVFLNEELQWLIYDENAALTLDTMSRQQRDSSFMNLLDDDLVQTNRFGSEWCHIYPTNANPEAEDPRLFSLCTGNTIIELTQATPKNVFGGSYFPFYVINLSKLPLSQWNYAAHPYKWYRPMNSVREPLLNANGRWLYGEPKYKEGWYGRFPQYGGDQRGAVAPIYPMCMRASDVGWIRADYVEILDPSKPLPPIFNM